MKRNIDQAINEVETTYEELRDIANDMVSPLLRDSNALIESISNNAYSLSLDSVREIMLKASLQTYSLSEVRDRASLKQECAETIKKNKYATQFNCSEGSVASRENNALINSSEETLCELVYDLVSSILKSKVDELHRLVDVLKSILLSKGQEMKMMNMGVAEDPDQYKTMVQINEESARRI